MVSDLIDINLEELIDNVLIKKSKSSDRDYSHFHPSEFNQCHRKLVYLYYEYKGVIKAGIEGVVDPRLQRIFDNGHHLHYRLGANLQDSGILWGVWRCKACRHLHGEFEKIGCPRPDNCCACGKQYFSYQEVGFFDEETLLGGHVDAILDIRGQIINGQEVSQDVSPELSHIVVDFKSMRAEAFRRLIEPKENHMVQMQIYLFLSGLKYGKFLYENKNDQTFREYLVKRDEEIIDRCVVGAKNLRKIATTKNSQGAWTLPVRAHKKNNTAECIECKYRSHCWNL